MPFAWYFSCLTICIIFECVLDFLFRVVFDWIFCVEFFLFFYVIFGGRHTKRERRRIVSNRNRNRSRIERTNRSAWKSRRKWVEMSWNLKIQKFPPTATLTALATLAALPVSLPTSFHFVSFRIVSLSAFHHVTHTHTYTFAWLCVRSMSTYGNEWESPGGGGR